MAHFSPSMLENVKGKIHLSPQRRSNYDVTDRICVTDIQAVLDEVCRLHQLYYSSVPLTNIKQAFVDFERVYTGDYPGYYAAETPYHDLQHCMDVTLCMARLMIGYNADIRSSNKLDADLFELGVIAAIFHDVGFIRKHGDEDVPSGAVYISEHVSRGGDFLAQYLPTLGLHPQVEHARNMLHFTGYEMAVSDIQTETLQHKVLGYMIASADLLAQMADRCYLEKCSSRLYDEFVFSQLACPDKGANKEADFLFDSRDDMMKKTVVFMQSAIDMRLKDTLGGVHDYISTFFGGTDLYMDAIEKSKQYLEDKLVDGGWQNALRRTAPWTLVTEQLTAGVN